MCDYVTCYTAVTLMCFLITISLSFLTNHRDISTAWVTSFLDFLVNINTSVASYAKHTHCFCDTSCESLQLKPKLMIQVCTIFSLRVTKLLLWKWTTFLINQTT